ncbi:CoA-binding protein [Galbibacter mesophilus]|uniref:CoA-binding protein n=1 Tax=Galbibacter mesophilus TaxID=379069 RepID=UPI00191D2462|nr:CoA-binding protein [Galbibacter mesophilus]MCM5663706.1 CoA-binding protein [Galbibacter mesophilus]
MEKTLVMGASLKPSRYSNIAINRLVSTGKEVVAFGLREGEVAGIAIDTDLKKYKDVHTVTLYLNAKNQESYYDFIIGLRPKRVIFNPGTENPDFYAKLRDNNIEVEVACTLVLLSTGQY